MEKTGILTYDEQNERIIQHRQYLNLAKLGCLAGYILLSYLLYKLFKTTLGEYKIFARFVQFNFIKWMILPISIIFRAIFSNINKLNVLDNSTFFIENSIRNRAIVLYLIPVLIVLPIYFYIIYKINRKYNISQTHGSNRWGRYRDLLKGYNSKQTFATDMLGDTGVSIGIFEADEGLAYNKHLILKDKNPTHCLVSAPTRSGKGVSFIIPTLLSWKESTVVLDIKGENYEITSEWRKQYFDNKILKFEPMSTDSVSYNPLSEVRTVYKNGRNEVDDVKSITDALTQDEDGKGDPFWSIAGSTLLQGLILFTLYKIKKENDGYIKDFLEGRIDIDNNNRIIKRDSVNNTPRKFTDIPELLIKEWTRDANFEDVINVLSEIPEPKDDKKSKNPLADFVKNLGGEKILDTSDELLMQQMIEVYPDYEDVIRKGQHPIVRNILVEKGTSGDVINSVKAVALNNLSLFMIPNVKLNTKYSEFTIESIMDGDTPVSLYLVARPKDIDKLAPLTRLVLEQMTNIILDQLSHKFKMMMMLDEFPAIGKVSVLEKGSGYVAGYGIKMVVVVQALDQLFSLYTDKNKLMGNLQVQVFYATNDDTTPQYISNRVGKETIEYYNSDKRTIERTSRDLLSIADVSKISEDRILCSVSGKPTFLLKKLEYFKHPYFKYRSQLPLAMPESDNIRYYYEGMMGYIKNSKQYIRLKDTVIKDGKTEYIDCQCKDKYLNYAPYNLKSNKFNDYGHLKWIRNILINDRGNNGTKKYLTNYKFKLYDKNNNLIKEIQNEMVLQDRLENNINHIFKVEILQIAYRRLQLYIEYKKLKTLQTKAFEKEYNLLVENKEVLRYIQLSEQLNLIFDIERKESSKLDKENEKIKERIDEINNQLNLLTEETSEDIVKLDNEKKLLESKLKIYIKDNKTIEQINLISKELSKYKNNPNCQKYEIMKEQLEEIQTISNEMLELNENDIIVNERKDFVAFKITEKQILDKYMENSNYYRDVKYLKSKGNIIIDMRKYEDSYIFFKVPYKRFYNLKHPELLPIEYVDFLSNGDLIQAYIDAKNSIEIEKNNIIKEQEYKNMVNFRTKKEEDKYYSIFSISGIKHKIKMKLSNYIAF